MADFAFHTSAPLANERWLSSRRCGQNLETAQRAKCEPQLTAIPSPIYNNTIYSGRFETGSTPSLPQSLPYPHGAASSRNLPATVPAAVGVTQFGRTTVEPSFPSPAPQNSRLPQAPFTSPASGPVPYNGAGSGSWGWDRQTSFPGNNQGPYQGRYSSDSMDDLVVSPSLSDYSLDNVPASSGGGPMPQGNRSSLKMSGKPRSQRRSSNRDEFDGPHQYLKRPPPEYVALQERELPQLPTHLLVQEQDSVLNQVNDRLSQCAYDFVAKYQFPIPLTQDMRPVERPQDREWTEWVYLLKRLATKRRIPARVLYNGQIKQFVTVLENSLEMRHAAKHQSRPLKDDRNILQLISAGIQVAKILKDAQAMDYLDRLYVSTERRIQERVAAAAAASQATARFR